MESVKVLVTGGAGYIGSITTRLLLDAGHACTVLDSLERSDGSAVDPRAQFIVADLGDDIALDRALKGCDAVVHFAGLIEVAESQAHPARFIETNVAKGARLLEAMLRHQTPMMVFSSTAAVYGEPLNTPIVEDDPTLPINAYGLSKLMFERLIEWAEATSTLRAVRLRYFNVAGAWPDGSLGEAHQPETHIIPRILTACRSADPRFMLYGDDYPTEDGSCVRDYVHVCDIAHAHVRALEHLAGGADGGVFNLGSGIGYSNLEVINCCAAITGAKPMIERHPRRAGDPAILLADPTKARQILGWEPSRSTLETMISDAWTWHTRDDR